MRVQVLYKVLENPTQASRRSLHVQHLVNTKANHKATLCFFARLDAVTNRLQDAYLHLWNWTVCPHVLTKLFLMLLLFNSLPPSHTHLKVTYIVNVIIQVLPVLAASVNLGEDHQLAVGIQPFSLLSWVSRRGLKKLRQRSLSITVLVYPS